MLNYTDITQNTKYPKLNGYGDNGQRKVWTSCISAFCTPTAYREPPRPVGHVTAFRTHVG